MPDDPNPISPDTDYTDCVGVICFRADDVLLIQRGKAPRKGEWSIPGGRIEAGETPRAAALRELFEETGVRAELGEKVEVILANFEGYAYRLHDYAAEWISGEPRAGDDAAQAKFVPPRAVAALGMWPKTNAVIETARALRKSQNPKPKAGGRRGRR